MRVYYSLYGHLLDKQRLYNGFKKVWKAKGAAGIDRQSLSDFASDLSNQLDQLRLELQTKQYKPQPVKRVEIPKDDGGVRLLGIPTVRDRVVQQTLNDLLTPIFEAQFHPSSFGYRPHRGCHDAINKATMFIRRYGLDHVVDMDLSKCFDKLDHELIIKSIRRRVTDSSVLALLRQFLKSGVMVDGNWQSTEIGSPQGGVISPLIANIYLDAFDQAMRERGHRIVRYADDILIFCRSRAGAENALVQATKILEKTLKLSVNQQKSHIAHSDEGVKFLGIEIGRTHTRIQPKKLAGFKAKLKRMTKRNSGKPLPVIIKMLNPVIRGFSQYFRIANANREFKKLAAWLRRRLRSIQLRLWKKPSRLHRRLRQRGYKPPFKWISMTSWRNAASPQASYAMPNQWFDELGLVNLEQVRTGYVFSIYAEWKCA
ncbi:group II intron reverse transcriptase/maturase [Salinivibrio kushneri]|uniref:group II intron reverse transcriptase/maturase n=1 Tax=Salinivibrio kushneri TaxID=1908198 RepID=UPI000986165C|nr:group II intron reverse transcriptase/maturase [Salinivibrio kushneri]OOE63004.1 group II intron reverse transcriptase/maturase [Salinivibrio kushneri]